MKKKNDKYTDRLFSTMVLHDTLSVLLLYGFYIRL